MAVLRTISAALVLVLVISTTSIEATEQQCDAEQADGLCSAARRDSGVTRYESFDDIPADIVERGQLKELGSHRDPDAEVDVLPYMISPEDFYEHYVVRHRPVVIKNVAKHWPASRLWTDEYLKETYGDIRMNMETRNDDKWNIPPSRKVGSFVDAYQKSNIYMVDELPPLMRKDVVMPLCLRCDEIAQKFFVSYFWMSNGGTASKLHIDTDENLLTVIHGNKDIVLISPKYSRDVYADEARMLGVSEVNVSAVDLHKFPRIANVRYLTAHLKAGDALYLPQMWWHYVYSGKGRQQAIAMWWKSIPFQKGFAMRSASTSRLRTEAEKAQDNRTTSLARWLEEYIWWIEDIRPDADARPKCENQIKLMADYPFETDKEQWREELTQGRAVTDDPTVDMEEASRCYFDMKNMESPCYFPACTGGDPEGAGGEKSMAEGEEGDEEVVDMKCVRFILDYCENYEDRGCVIELPQHLNKKSNDEMEQLEAMKKLTAKKMLLARKESLENKNPV